MACTLCCVIKANCETVAFYSNKAAISEPVPLRNTGRASEP